LSILLDSRYPMYIAWGSEFTQFYNDAYRPILGATKHPAALGQGTAECFPEIWDFIGPMFERVLREGEATYLEDQILPLDRNGYVEECYFTFCYSAIREESGRPGGVLVTVIETTERVLSERRLRTLRELALAAGNAPDDVAACGAAGRVLDANPQDLPFAAIYLFDDHRGTARRAATAGHHEGDPAWEVLPPDVSLARGPDAWPLAAAARSPTSTRVRASDVGIRNLPGARVWGEAPEELVVTPLVLPGQAEPAGLLVAGVNSRKHLDEQYESFLGLVAGQVAGAVAESRAALEERRRAAALTALDRAKTAFFSNVSHEFRTPVTLLLGPLEDALEDLLDPLAAPQRERIEVAHRNSLRLLKLVNTLLDFSRIEAGRVEASYEPTDLAAFTADLASVFRSAIERAGLRLVVDCEPQRALVYVDRDMWEKIVLNLLSNALKFTLEGEIAVALRQVDDGVRLTVTDTGIGIPAEDRTRVFERFHRVRSARGRTHEGTGIGLSLAQELVRLHGGRIEVTSEVDRGTRFTVTIPTGTAHLPRDQIGSTGTLASTALGAVPFLQEALRWGPGATEQASDSLLAAGAEPVRRTGAAELATSILVVDDNADMRDYVTRLLSGRWTVFAAADGLQALAKAQACPPDLVISDIMMPGLNGFELLARLRADPRTRTVPFILLSARAGEESRIEGLAAGADDYLVKPFSARELTARVEGTLALVRARREADAALRENEERYRLALRAAQGVVCDWNVTSGEVLWSDGLQDVFGFSAQEAGTDIVRAIPWWETQIHPEDRARVHAGFDAFLEGPDEVWSVEYRFGRADGRWATVRSHASVARDEHGRPLRVIGSMLDITELKVGEERLRQSAKMEAIGRLAGGLAHDFNNHLHALAGFANFVGRESGLSGSARKDLIEVQKAADRMASLTRQLLAFSRQQVLAPETLDLKQALADTQSMLQRLIGTNIEVHLELAPGPLWVRVDRAQLTQVCLNLAVNARDAMPEGGRFTLSTGRRRVEAGSRDVPAAVAAEPANYVQLTASDTGTGISIEHLPRIFEPFFTTKEVGQGTGLGLATVHGIVAQSGGHIWVDSAALHGTTFTLLLPVASAPRPSPQPSIPTHQRSRGPRGRVLVVEDEGAVRATAVRALSEENIEVLEAGNGCEALECLETAGGRVDLILSDVVMPVLGGAEFASRLAERWPELPVIWMSGYPREATFAGHEVGEKVFLQKPVDLDHLVATVARALERAGGAAT
ncbi:MAG: ATP-binding protein, partial [Gemmatimonadales bacterium]